MKKIITISREFGSGAGEVGKLVAAELGYEYCDKTIILNAARESNIDVERILRWDEKSGSNLGFAQSLFDFYSRPIDEKVFEAQSQVIKKIGEKGNCVIVGRNANSILKHFDNTLHVFFCADSNWKLERLLKIYPDSTAKKMADQMIAIDKKRRKYCSYYTNTEFGAAANYDICLNTSRLGLMKCKDIIIDLAKN